MEYIIAALFGALIAQGGNTHETAFTECELVDQGGYFTFADPTCAAAFSTGDSEDDDDEITN